MADTCAKAQCRCPGNCESTVGLKLSYKNSFHPPDMAGCGHWDMTDSIFLESVWQDTRASASMWQETGAGRTQTWVGVSEPQGSSVPSGPSDCSAEGRAVS